MDKLYGIELVPLEGMAVSLILYYLLFALFFVFVLIKKYEYKEIEFVRRVVEYFFCFPLFINFLFITAPTTYNNILQLVIFTWIC